MILMPTRGRPDNIKRFLAAYKSTNATLPVTLLCDADDECLEEYKAFSIPVYIGDKRAGIVALVNEWFRKNRDLNWYALIADDVVPTTQTWDIILLSRCMKEVISWADDGQEGAMLATHCFIRGDLCRYFNFISYPKLYHGYVDLLWTLAAYMINAGMGYCGDVRLEHLNVEPKQFDRNADEKEYNAVLPLYVHAIKYFNILRKESGMADEVKGTQMSLKEYDAKKILIAIASGGSSSDTFNIYLQNVWASSGNPNIIYEQSPYIHWNRESCAEHAVEKDYEYLMFFDNDMVFPLDIIHRLFVHDVDVVTSNYVTKERPSRFMAIDMEGKECYTSSDKDGLEKVWMAPTGTMLIKTEIFKKLEKPWFDTSRTHKLGEDYYFTNKCRNAGIDVYVDHTLSKEVGHEGKYIYTWRDTPVGGCVDNFCNEKFPGGVAKKIVGTKAE